MELNSLSAIGPLDGRYGAKTEPLRTYFSEFGLIRYRVAMEIKYFDFLCRIPLPELASISSEQRKQLPSIYESFTEADAKHIKALEVKTNHDVKAVEYFIKEKFDQLSLSDYKEFIHFGLTSQDVNNTAIPWSLKEAARDVLLPGLKDRIAQLAALAEDWKGIPMLARTHGQPASPTRLGKEIQVFVVRLQEQLAVLSQVPFAAKFGGATGNFNAHHVAYPELDWIQLGNEFVEKDLGLKRSQPTTQIEHYDHLAAWCDAHRRINTILIDFCRDVWHYISIQYFNQKIDEGHTGSSAMPHKVNPIDFENAEGNLGLANALFGHLAEKLPISRLQRDLTDSTVLRNLGMPHAYQLIAWDSLRKGLSKLEVNKVAIAADLEDNWAVVAEAIQTVLRRHGYPQPYEALKSLTRKNEKVSQESIHDFIDGLDVDPEIKKQLKNISPHNYTGL